MAIYIFKKLTKKEKVNFKGKFIERMKLPNFGNI